MSESADSGLTTTHRDYDHDEPSGTRREPHPGKGFDDYNVGDTVPVPRYFGKMNWVFEGAGWLP